MNSKYKVITIKFRNHYDYVPDGWYQLEEYLNWGWSIIRVDSFSGGGGWKPMTGCLVYILSNEVKSQ